MGVAGGNANLHLPNVIHNVGGTTNFAVGWAQPPMGVTARGLADAFGQLVTGEEQSIGRTLFFMHGNTTWVKIVRGLKAAAARPLNTNVPNLIAKYAAELNTTYFLRRKNRGAPRVAPMLCGGRRGSLSPRPSRGVYYAPIRA